MVTVGDLLLGSLRNGISPSKSGRMKGIVLTLSAITRGVFDASALKESMFAASLAQDQTVSASLFLICRGNGNRQLVGRGAFPPSDMPGVAFPDTMIAFRPDDAQIEGSYLSAMWSSGYLRAQIEAAAKTTNGTYKINQGSIERFTFPLAPGNVQAAYAEQVERIGTLARGLDAAAAKADAMAAALSAEVFEAGPSRGNGHAGPEARL
jgi:type I restriction enzyme S subunit